MRSSIILTLTISLVFSFVSEAQKRPYKKGKASIQKEHFTDRDKLNYEAAFFNGLRQKALGNLESAAEDFLKCIRLDGSKAAPMYELAMINYGFGKYSEALFFIESAYEIEEDNIWYHQLLAEVYISSQKYKSAIISYKKLLKKQPGNEDWHIQLASAYLLDNQLQKAIEVYNDMEKHIGVSEALIMQKYRIHLNLKDRSGATSELEKWIESEPKNPKPYSLMAEMYLLEGNHEKAIDVLERILEIDPNNGKAHLNLSELYRNNVLLLINIFLYLLYILLLYNLIR